MKKCEICKGKGVLNIKKSNILVGCHNCKGTGKIEEDD